MTPRMPIKYLNKLKSARRYATLETASFGMPNDRITVNGVERHPTDYIREMVRNHHASWVIYPLDVVIAWAEKDNK